MIRYALRCDQGHDFDGWFRSSEAFETMRTAGHVACTQCGSVTVEKSLMAPAVAAARQAEPAVNPVEAALQTLRQQVEANSDYVGLKFADEARAMHEGRAPTRAIHGEAKIEEARKLIEDGVPVAPLPFVPRQKAN
ncbi:DUF1178 family protein [Paracoccus benzoatiresistens]|uniref:DUF1178 family protein n=1 Tax=Paracoccus benzoatiresistens TaxID=2997341 RepID=A0ABT4J2Z8_9RHOB|nr:DUF1178 family protein [Paracoccus sp. EF6]MCZ0961500.1 DUF1178 family protein [Paracoccus sp. EF6]